MKFPKFVLLVTLSALSLAACISESDSTLAENLALGCFAIQSVSDDSFLMESKNQNYRLSTAGKNSALRFLFKPSGNGNYLLRDQLGGYLSLNQGQVTRASKVGDGSEWRVHYFPSQRGSRKKYMFVSTQGHFRLSVVNTILQAKPVVLPMNREESAFDLISEASNRCDNVTLASVD